MAKPVVRKPKKKQNPLKAAKIDVVDYKDTALLRKFISDRGKIRARRVTGVSVQEQRAIAAPSRTPARWRSCRTRRRPLRRGDHMAKIILTHEVTGLGEPGDVVEVKDGYARNYLVPRGLATPWTKGAEKDVDRDPQGPQGPRDRDARRRQGDPRLGCRASRSS